MRRSGELSPGMNGAQTNPKFAIERN